MQLRGSTCHALNHEVAFRRQLLGLQGQQLRVCPFMRHPSAILRIRGTKNGESRLVPLSSSAVEVLAGLPRDNVRVMPASGNALRLAWERLKAKLGITDLRMHDLRRKAASRAFEKGLSLAETMLLTGHKTPAILLRVYAALEAKRVASRLG